MKARIVEYTLGSDEGSKLSSLNYGGTNNSITIPFKNKRLEGLSRLYKGRRLLSIFILGPLLADIAIESQTHNFTLMAILINWKRMMEKTICMVVSMDCIKSFGS